MSSGTTLVNLTCSTLNTHLHPHQFQHHLHPHQNNNSLGAQLNMLDSKMSSSLSPVAPVNILSECYIGMWDNEMDHPPPTKLETTDIMDLIEPSLRNDQGEIPDGGGGCSSPTTIIHHTGDSSSHHHNQNQNQNQSQHQHSQQSHSDQSRTSSSYPGSTTTSSSSPSSSSTTSSTSSYLHPLPSLGDPYGPGTAECHLLEGFHGGMEPPFHKMTETSHAFQEGGYDAFISDMTSDGHHNHHQQHHHEHPSHPHHPQHPPHHHPHPPHSTLQNISGMSTPCHDSSNGVLLLDMSNHHPHSLHGGAQCSPGCPCGTNPYSLGGETLGELCPPPHGVLSHHPHHNPHSHHTLHHHNPHHHHPPHPQDYSSTWDDLHCEAGDYSILFRKGESPSTSDSISYTDNDSESKSSGGSLSGLNEITHVSPPKRKVGRPPKKDKKLKRNEKKTGRLWEFIRDLLKNPEYCPSLVKWENHEEGHFRFVNSEKVAQLWGQIKGNPRMTYEKLSRAMRYYYKSHVFEPVLGRRLVYKFGYNATNWKPLNPNFASPSHHPKIMYN